MFRCIDGTDIHIHEFFCKARRVTHIRLFIKVISVLEALHFLLSEHLDFFHLPKRRNNELNKNSVSSVSFAEIRILINSRTYRDFDIFVCDVGGGKDVLHQEAVAVEFILPEVHSFVQHRHAPALHVMFIS